MECRLCSLLISVFFFFPQMSHAQSQCGNEEYINWMGRVIEEKKEKIGGISSMIPTSLALAQSILESGYGKSQAARSKHNHFGLSKKGKLKAFSSPKESVRYYLETLSFHNAYRRFRDFLLKGETNPFVLISHVAPAYAEDSKYEQRIKAVIKSCDLERFDLERFDLI